jgi:hypothetical protein
VGRKNRNRKINIELKKKLFLIYEVGEDSYSSLVYSDSLEEALELVKDANQLYSFAYTSKTIEELLKDKSIITKELSSKEDLIQWLTKEDKYSLSKSQDYSFIVETFSTPISINQF